MPGIRFSVNAIPRSLIIVLLVALVIRILYLMVYSSMPDWTMLTIDNYYHHNWAENIANGNIWGDTTYFRAPLYVYALAILYVIFGTSLWVARIFGLVIGLASIFLTFQISQKLFSRRVGVIAAMVQAVFPTVIYFESELLLDAFYMLLLQISLYRFILWFEDADKKKSFVLGLALGLASLARPITLIFTIPILLISLLKKSEGFRQNILQITILGAGLAVVVLPITIRNLIVGKEFVLIAAHGGINFYIGNNTAADGLSASLPEPLGHNWEIRDITYIADQAAGKELKPGEVSSFWFKRTIDEIIQHPLAALTLFRNKIYFNISNREISNNRNLADFIARHPLLKFNPLSFGLIFSLAIFAVFSGWRAHLGVRILFIAIIIYVLTVAIFFFNSRFRLPVLALYFILAAAGVESIVNRIRSIQSDIIAPLVAGIIAAIVSFAPLVALPLGIPTQHLTLRGLNYYYQNDFKSALDYFTRAARLDPTFPEVNLNIGAGYLKLGQTDSALYYFERERQLHPRRALSYSNIASIYLVQNRPVEALAEVTHALALKPYHEISQLIRLRAAAQISEISSDSFYTLALSAINETRNDIALTNYAAVVLTNRSALENAKSFLNTAIQMKPPAIEIDDDAFTPYFSRNRRKWIEEMAQSNNQLGYITGLEGKFEESIRYSRQAIELDPLLKAAYLNLISGLNASGQPARADSVLDAANRRFGQLK